MGILDWFAIRPQHSEHEDLLEESVAWSVDKAVTIVNPRLKALPDLREHLGPAAAASLRYLRQHVGGLASAIPLNDAQWAVQPALRAFFAAPGEIPQALGRSNNLRTFFTKFPQLAQAYVILGVEYRQRQVAGMALQDGIVRGDVVQTVADFSQPAVRICGQNEEEVRQILITQCYEYLVAQALCEVAEKRGERQELEENRALLRARLRLLQQQGPGLGSLFGAPPANAVEQAKLEAELLANERDFEAIGGIQSILDSELEALLRVLTQPERYIRFEAVTIRINSMNVVVDESSSESALKVDFGLARLDGEPKLQRAFVIGCLDRETLPPARLDLEGAARYL